jgi:hypothetical protein
VPVRDADHDAFGEEIGEQSKHPTGLTPVHSPVHTQQAEIADRLGVDDDAGEEFDETAEPYDSDPAAEAYDAEDEGAFEPVAVAPTPVAAPVPVSVPRRSARPRSVTGAKSKAAFTLRLEPNRHLKLRLACAVNGRSAQQLVTDALDQLLAAMPELDAMAEKAKRKG